MNKVTNNSKSRRSNKLIISIIAAILIGSAIFYFYKQHKEQASKPELTGPAFTNNGSLAFIKKGTSDTLKFINIEVAQTEEKREMGLMFRRSMKDNEGMLFIFDEESPRSFWMKNTYIPLDIIYVNASKEIGYIRENATPLSEESIPSVKPSQYVVEVNADFCYKYNIQEGDRISFNIK